ncbi:aminoglycoside phosphotransferase family protein [Halomonas sp. LS-001]
MTHPSASMARRIIDRKGYRSTLLEKVELAVAVDVQRRKIDGSGFQQSKSLERLATLLDQLGQACMEVTDIKSLKHLSDKRRKEYAKLIRWVGKSLKLVIINIDDANTRQGLKLGRRIPKISARLSNTSEAANGAVLDFQIHRMTQLLAELADALLAANFGPAVRLQNYKQLKNAAHAITNQEGDFTVERLALTRSGSTIATLKAEHASSGNVMAVYKEGQSQKVMEELSGVHQWQQVYPKVAPTVLSHNVEPGSELASMVIEHLPGRTLESMLLNSQWEMAYQLVDKLRKTLRKIWKSSRTHEPPHPEYMQQLRKRMPETYQAHPTLFQSDQSICGLTRPSFDSLMDHVERLESQVRAPFSVLIHGDFNVDNIIYDELKKRIYFIDLHRASYSDYAQDLSVLMVSIYRLPVMDASPRAELMRLIRLLYQFARRFAKDTHDADFDVRLAIALGRSFATSTRFIYDRNFARKLALRASYLLEAITRLKSENYAKYRLPLEDIFND